MPEALVIVLVAVVAVVVYVVLWVQSRNPALYDPRRERARLEQHLGWLEQRLELARREDWDDAMVGSLAADYAATAEQLAEVRQQVGDGATDM